MCRALCQARRNQYGLAIIELSPRARFSRLMRETPFNSRCTERCSVGLLVFPPYRRRNQDLEGFATCPKVHSRKGQPTYFPHGAPDGETGVSHIASHVQSR